MLSSVAARRAPTTPSDASLYGKYHIHLDEIYTSKATGDVAVCATDFAECATFLFVFEEVGPESHPTGGRATSILRVYYNYYQVLYNNAKKGGLEVRNKSSLTGPRACIMMSGIMSTR